MDKNDSIKVLENCLAQLNELSQEAFNKICEEKGLNKNWIIDFNQKMFNREELQKAFESGLYSRKTDMDGDEYLEYDFDEWFNKEYAEK